MSARPLRVNILREFGGIGDVICCLPALRYWADSPDHEVHLYGGEYWRPLWEMSCCRYTWHEAKSCHSGRLRDRWYPPAAHYGWTREEEGYQTIDLWCPCWPHEQYARPGYPKLGRLEIFCNAAHMPTTEIPKLYPPGEAILWAHALRASSARNLVVLMPCASGWDRAWDRPGGWEAVYRALVADGHQVIVVTGDGMETVWAWSLPPGALYVRLPLDRLAALYWIADLAISPDTGGYHLAAAVGTPALGLFGPTSGAITSRYYPLAQWIQGEPVAPQHDCRAPCYRRMGGAPVGHGWIPQCEAGCAAMSAITPEVVIEKARAMLAERGRIAI